MSDSIFLVGFMGSGKSAVGRELADRLGWEYLDLDEEIVRVAGHSIPEIFHLEGEETFRNYEADALQQALSGHQQVVSCGGGIVTQPTNLEALLKAPGSICLDVSPEEVWNRIGQDPNRPLLQGAHPKKQILTLMEERTPLYSQFPKRVMTDGRSTTEVVDQILSQLGKQ